MTNLGTLMKLENLCKDSQQNSDHRHLFKTEKANVDREDGIYVIKCKHSDDPSVQLLNPTTVRFAKSLNIPIYRFFLKLTIAVFMGHRANRLHESWYVNCLFNSIIFG